MGLENGWMTQYRGDAMVETTKSKTLENDWPHVPYGKTQEGRLCGCQSVGICNGQMEMGLAVYLAWPIVKLVR